MTSKAQAARQICATLQAAGHKALFAGGCVRDFILGVTPKDIDIATDARPEDILTLFPKCISVGAHFGVILVLHDEGPFEVATFRKDGPYSDGRHPDYVKFVTEQEDAQRRDFTINALFLDPDTAEILDFVGGRDDLRDGLIRCVGTPEKRFEEDHLRLLRAVRFAARLGYTIAPDTLRAIRQMSSAIVQTSAERIRDELIKMLTEGQAEQALLLLDNTGLLPHVLPEISAMKGVEQPEVFHPEGDVFMHTRLMLRYLDTQSPTLAMAALLHDVGKPDTQTFEDRIRFNLHHKVGARISEKICRRFRFSNAQTERIAWLVGQHMRLADIPEMKESRRKRFVRTEGFDELLELCRLDCAASHGDCSTIDWIRNYLEHLAPDTIAPPPLVTGHDLIALGYRPSPRFKTILQAVEDQQLEGHLFDKKDALAWLQEHFPKHTPLE